MSWQGGRQLASMQKDGTTLSFSYNDAGLRTEKTVNGSTRRYIWNSSQLMADVGANDAFYFHYSSGGELIGYTYKTAEAETECILVKNQQGDVERVISADGTVLASYTYDAWGNVLTSEGSLATANPIRYRGYYFDTETSLYYVSSRYYDSGVGRWISADASETLTADFENLAQYNLFAYCFNNPVNTSDKTGTWPSWATKLAIGIGAIIIGAAVVAATAATGGAAAAFIGAAVAGVKAAAVSGAIAAAIGAGTSAVSHRVSTGSWSGAGKAAVDGAVEGFANGFMTGGIMAGGSQILSSGFKVAANAGVPTGRNGGLTIGNKIRVLSPNHPQSYEAGGTLLKIGSKYRNIRFDVGSNSLFHMNIQLAKTANYHLPIGIFGAGLWGGFARD